MKRNFFLLWVFWCIGWSSICCAVTKDIQVDISDRIKLTQSGLVLNRTTRTYDTTVSLTNISNTLMTGPLMVSVSTISPSSVTLANATGTSATGSTVIAVPAQQSLNPGQSVGNIVLKFKNPNNVKFTFTTSVLGNVSSQQGVNNVSSLFPTNGYSGTVVTITGNNFLPYSVVKFGDKTVQNFDYLSPQQIQFVVPLDVNQDGHLISLNPGDYQVTVDDGVGISFTVNALPANPNPVGVVLNTTIQQLQQFTFQNQTSYHNAINYLLAQPLDSNLLAALKIIDNIDNDILQTIDSYLPYAISNTDSKTLDTIERLLLAGQNNTIQISSDARSPNTYQEKNTIDIASVVSKIIGIKQAMAATGVNDPYPGNTWMDQRGKLLTLSKFNSQLDKILKIGSVASIATPPVLAILGMINAGGSIIESVLTTIDGSIEKFDIDAMPNSCVNGVGVCESTLPAPAPLSFDSYRVLTIDISNKDVALGIEKQFSNPRITVSHKLDVGGLFVTVSKAWPGTTFIQRVCNTTVLPWKLVCGEGIGFTSTSSIKKISKNINDLFELLTKYLGSSSDLSWNGYNTEMFPSEGPLAISIDRVEWDDNTNVLPGTWLRSGPNRMNSRIQN